MYEKYIWKFSEKSANFAIYYPILQKLQRQESFHTKLLCCVDCRVVGQHKVCLLCTQLGLMGVVDKAAASFQLVKAHELEEDYSSISSSSSAKFFLFPRCRRSRSCSRSEVYYVLRQARGRRWRRPNKLRAFFLCKARTAFTSMKKTRVCDFGLFLA